MQELKAQIRQPQKKSQDAVFYNITRSICPVCRAVIDAQIIVRENRVFMRKRCAKHGWFESLVSSDFDFYRYSENFNKPGLKPFEFQTNVEQGCPSDCGLCPEHKQHTCLAIFEITSKCNMQCPICFAESGVHNNGQHLSLETVNHMIDTLVQSEGTPEIVQLSGGEPTLHPELLAIIQRLEEVGTKRIMINTNGRKFARNFEFCKEIVDISDAVGVYLQFDGFKDSTYDILRGNRNLLEEKLLAIENLRKSGILITLVMTAVQHVNDGEMGDIIRFMHKTEGIAALVIQPLFNEGRVHQYDPLNHLTVPDVIKAIEEQTRGEMYVRDDWFPIPCPHPYCSACTFSYVDPETEEFTTIKRLVEVEDYLDFFQNRTLPTADVAIREALESTFSFSASGSSKELVEGYCQACGIELNLQAIEEALGHYMKHVKMITIKPFMSAWDLDLKRLMKCCIHEVLPSGKIMPFCAYNTLYRKGMNSPG
ncbi:MAG: radical SAM protein [Candidatus Thorarchaeota archaeon]